MESNSGPEDVTFTVLQTRLLSVLRYRINNGEFTERGLARLIGLSQPQVHNLLKGARKLSPATADLFLATLHLTVLDLLAPSDLDRREPAANSTSGSCVPINANRHPSSPPLLTFEPAFPPRKPPARDVSDRLPAKKRIG